MKKYLAYVCGHYLPIGYEEFYAALEAEGIEYKIVHKNKQIIIFESEKDPTAAAARCAFIHALILLSDTGEIENNKINITEDVKHLEIEKNKTFCVRVCKIGRKEINISSVDLERKLGNQVYFKYEKSNLEVDLVHPDYSFLAILHGTNFFLGLELWSLDRKKYFVRESSERDFFRPGGMKTDFARAIVNLSRINKGEIFFDPFCGGGGFLLEASELGAYVIGSDLDTYAVRGANRNLKQFENYNSSLYRGDSRYLAIKEADAIATDPPYSLQSSTHGEKVPNLIYDFLIATKDVLKPGKHLVFSSPASISSEDIVEKTDYKLVTLIDCVIHKSLTRRILVLK